MNEAIPEQTLAEDSSNSHGLSSAPRFWLIYIGSAEDHFKSAGQVWSLDQIRTVRFGRSSSNELDSDVTGQTMHIGIPLGWVSHSHSEVRVITGKETEFDIRDLASRNGTKVQGSGVPGIARLDPGSVFEIGRSFWMIRATNNRDLPAEQVRMLDPAGTSSPTLGAIHRTLVQLASSPTPTPIVLAGETGTGKEFISRRLHQMSKRSGQFIPANLCAIPDARLDSVFFDGLESDRSSDEGGAEALPSIKKKGLFARSSQGTLFLDEVAEFSPTVQSKLHAALTRITHASSQGASPPPVRTIASTLHNLREMVQNNRFRPDLYSRLAGFEANIPPLRERREDLGALCHSLCRTDTGEPITMTTKAFRRVLAYSWPFNIRELGQTLATARILAGPGGEISDTTLDEILSQRGDLPDSPETVQELRTTLVSQLAKNHGDTVEVARALERDPKEIHHWLERFELHPDAYKEE